MPVFAHGDATSDGRYEESLAGVVVIGAVQDPRKDVIPQRDLFPVRIGLRMSEAEHVTLVLGNGARNRGACCDLIPDTLPGVGYVVMDGIAEPVRVRFAFHTDTDLDRLSQPDANWGAGARPSR